MVVITLLRFVAFYLQLAETLDSEYFYNGHDNKTMTQIKWVIVYISVRENRRNNQEWTIQTLRQCWAYKTEDEDKQYTTQHKKLKR